MKIKFSSDDDLPLKKTLDLCNMVIVVRAVFHEDNKYYLQDECLYKLKMLKHNRINVSKRIVVSKTGM